VDAFFDQIGTAVGNVLNSVPVRLLVGGLVAYLAVLWLAAAAWTYRDMRRRLPNPVAPYVAALAIVLASPVLLPLSMFTYLVLRPRETLAELRERDLIERLEVINADLDLACPGCRRRVEEHWLLCPGCRTRLARQCRSCGRTMGLDWTLCGFCGAEFGRAVLPQRVPAAIRGGSVAPQMAPGSRAPASSRTVRSPSHPRLRGERVGEPRRELLEGGA
jgi:hypothetical protein